MKLPKAIIICGKTYKVSKNPKMFGGSADTLTQTMVIGTQSKKTERRFEGLVHEIMESIACEKEYRYGKGVSENSIFVMNHKEFDSFAMDVAATLRPLMR